MKEIIHNFISSSGSGTGIDYGSGSTTLRPGPVVYLCLDCFRRGREGRTHRSCHAYSILRRDFCLLEAGWTAGQAIGSTVKFRPPNQTSTTAAYFFLKMQLTNYSDKENYIFISFHYRMLSNFGFMFSI
jgi:hypothetical protein